MSNPLQQTMELFVFGLVVGGALGFAMARMFTYDAEPAPKKMSQDELVDALSSTSRPRTGGGE